MDYINVHVVRYKSYFKLVLWYICRLLTGLFVCLFLCLLVGTSVSTIAFDASGLYLSYGSQGKEGFGLNTIWVKDWSTVSVRLSTL